MLVITAPTDKKKHLSTHVYIYILWQTVLEVPSANLCCDFLYPRNVFPCD